jgi:hypothetical protein
LRQLNRPVEKYHGQLIVAHGRDPAPNGRGVSPGARQDALLMMLVSHTPDLMPLLYAVSPDSKRSIEKIQPSD